VPKSFQSGKTEDLLPADLIGQLTRIYEFKGKEALYQVQAPELLAVLQKSAIVESTESSNRIEGVVASPGRVRAIVDKGAAPVTRSEAEIAGYRDVLGQIHASHEHIRPTPNVIRQFHRDLFKYTGARAGVWKPVDNTIETTMADGSKEVIFVPVSALATPGAIEELCGELAKVDAAGVVDPLVATAAFVLDFLCIHPFLDGNGRLARLLTTLLLYRSGFVVGRYVGVERVVEQTKPSYYASLRESSEGWHAGEHSLLPWLTYLLGVILAAYRELDTKLGGGGVPSKAERVRLAFELMPAVFTKAELAGACPDISSRTLKRVLEELRTEGKVEVAKLGRGGLWRKV
jgi:Fic family protein